MWTKSSGRSRLREAAADLALVAGGDRRLDAGDDARSVLRLDRLALSGRGGQLEILDVAPACAFDRDDETLHTAMIAGERGGARPADRPLPKRDDRAMSDSEPLYMRNPDLFGHADASRLYTRYAAELEEAGPH